MSNTTISKSIFFSASRETVWAYLTEKDKLGEWFHSAEADLAMDQDYALIRKEDNGSVTKMCWGTVFEMKKPARLVYSFTVKPLGGAMTTVTWVLDEVEGGTRLSLTHEGIDEAAGDAAMGLILALDKGWDSHLAGLRSKMPAGMSTSA